MKDIDNRIIYILIIIAIISFTIEGANHNLTVPKNNSKVIGPPATGKTFTPSVKNDIFWFQVLNFNR